MTANATPSRAFCGGNSPGRAHRVGIAGAGFLLVAFEPQGDEPVGQLAHESHS
jgi:hypothetical protein